MKPELLTEQDIEDVKTVIRAHFGPLISEPLIAKIINLNLFVDSLEEGIEDGSDAVESGGADFVAWEDDDA